MKNLAGLSIVKNYACSSQGTASDSFFRFIRLIPTGLHSSEGHLLKIGTLEFYGDLDEQSFATA
jgi:hypothetical protein